MIALFTLQGEEIIYRTAVAWGKVQGTGTRF